MICIFPFAKGIVGGDCTFYTEIPACLKDDANSIAMLLHDYLVPKIWNFTIAVSDNDTIEGNADIDDFIQRAGAWLASTFPAYDVRINAFNSLKTKLLDEVSSESINKFNDAPQTPYIAGETDGDDHLTNLTKNIQTSQVTTNANRRGEKRNGHGCFFDCFIDCLFHDIFLYMIINV